MRGVISLLATAAAAACAAAALAFAQAPSPPPEAVVPTAAPVAGFSAPGTHEGVASCAGSTCHGRAVASGPVIRQNEYVTWQSAGPAGAHARAWRVLTSERSADMARRLGIGPAERAPQCLSCHAEPAGPRGEKFQISDGVGCESCHGASGGWLAGHYALGATHADNVAKGLIPLEDPKVRARVCLDCHYGSAKPNQFVTHEIMAAGHPRISFELDLFTSLQRHHDADADYARRKATASGVKTWAVGQAMALDRALTLYGSRGRNGAFPEFTFFDCHSCHRPISDDPAFRPKGERNPARPIPAATPPFNDESMIVLAAAAKVAAPDVAPRFERDSRAFHQALGRDPAEAARAASTLAATARTLSSTFAARAFSRAETLAMLREVVGEATNALYTDYSGGAQAVMAADALLSSMTDAGQVDRASSAAIRAELDQAYRAVRDPMEWRPAEFREAMRRVSRAVGRLS